MTWLTRNWGLKMVSFFLAVGLWYYATGEEGIEVTRYVPVEVKVNNSQMSILKMSVPSVQVTFMAPRAMLSDLMSEEVKAYHEIGNEVKKAGEYSFRIEPGEIKLKTPQIRIVKIEPEVLDVTLDELIVQKVAIKPNFLGEPAFGYKVYTDKIEMNPNAAMLEGPKGQLEKLQSIKTEKVDLVGRIRSFRRTLNLEIPANIKILSEDVVDLYVPIQEAYDEKEFKDIPVKVLLPAGKQEAEFKPEKVVVTLKGPRKEFEGLGPDKITAYVDASNLQEGEHNVEAQVILPEGLSLKADKISVKILIKK